MKFVSSRAWLSHPTHDLTKNTVLKVQEDRLGLINLTNGPVRTVWMLYDYTGELMERYPRGRPSASHA